MSGTGHSEGPGVVVVGTGFGCITHVRALRAAGFDVLAVVGRDPDRTVERAAMFDVPRALTSLTEALALPGADAVTIATPPQTHAALAHEAIEAGRHVLCEKPMAADREEAAGMVEAAERAGVVHLLGTEFRFDTGQALMARAVQEGRIGEPRLIDVLLHVPVLADPDAEVPSWWADADQGGGWLGAHGSQVIDQVRALGVEFEAVSASTPSIIDRAWTADDAFIVQFRTTEGAAGVLMSTPSDHGAMLVDTRVVGTEGTVWIEGMGDDVRIATAEGSRRLDVPDYFRTPPPEAPPEGALVTTYDQMMGHGLDLGPYTRRAEHIRPQILDTPPPPGSSPADFTDGLAQMAVLDAARSSVRVGQWVDVARSA
jgi:predicted dehydrogenase